MSLQEQANVFAARWASHINKLELEEVLALYNDEFVLMPTFSADNIQTRDALRAYFVNLSSKPGIGVDLHEQTIKAQAVGGEGFVITGLYDFKFEVEGTLTVFPSRFTFVIDLAQASPLLHHHSSQLPK